VDGCVGQEVRRAALFGRVYEHLGIYGYGTTHISLDVEFQHNTLFYSANLRKLADNGWNHREMGDFKGWVGDLY